MTENKNTNMNGIDRRIKILEMNMTEIDRLEKEIAKFAPLLSESERSALDKERYDFKLKSTEKEIRFLKLSLYRLELQNK